MFWKQGTMCIFFFFPPVAVCFPSIWSTICNEGLVAFQSRRLIDKISCQENREREKKLNGVSFFKGAAALVYLPQSIFLLLLTFKVRFRILFKPKHIIYYVFSQQFQTTKCCNKMSLRLTDIANRAPSSHLSIILFFLFCLYWYLADHDRALWSSALRKKSQIVTIFWLHFGE